MVLGVGTRMVFYIISLTVPFTAHATALWTCSRDNAEVYQPHAIIQHFVRTGTNSSEELLRDITIFRTYF